MLSLTIKQKDIMQKSISLNPTQEIKDFVKAHSRKDSLLYNNRLFFGYVNPSDKRKKEYENNREFILWFFS